MEQRNTVLELMGVNKIYGKGNAAVHAVTDVNFKVEQGDVTLIMGPSGSGKTTLLSISGALLKPTDGSVYINGTEITKLSEKALPGIRLKNIGFIFQAFNLLSALSVMENVELTYNLLGLNRQIAKKKAVEILSELGLKNRLDHYPDEISGGEKQRVAIARALAAEPNLILADEPTGNLDSKSGHHVVELLHNIAKDRGSAVVVVSHDMRIMDIADRVLRLEDGRLFQTTDLLTDPVCGMSFTKVDAVSDFYFHGASYYFCSRRCLELFMDMPEKFIKN